MTTVHRLTWREKAAMTLGHFGEYCPRKQFDREDIPKIRRMRREGYKPADIIESLKINMSVPLFKERCEELGLTFDRERDVGEAIALEKGDEWGKRATQTLSAEKLGPRPVGPIEAAQMERVKQAKKALYSSGGLPEPDARDQRIVELEEALEAVRKEVLALRFKLAEYSGPQRCLGSTILNAVAREYKVTVADLKSDRRHKHLVIPRHYAMWLMRKFTSLSFPQIGRIVGDRDHTTVLHACNSIEHKIAAGWQFPPIAEVLND